MKEHASFNRCYRLLWSGTTEQWKPVPETARTAKKGGRGKAANTLTLAGVLPGVAMGLFVMSNLAAQPPPAPPTAPATTQLPTGGTVAAGQATISQSAIATAANMVVNQTSQRAVIDWSNFNVGSGATVQFVQPNAQSVILNRVLDANPTQVFGRINANGQVFLTNPYGVYFAPTASVDVGGLVATTYSISNDDFMAGRYTFNRNGSTARVVNEGNLSASLGGYIALLAPEVQNSGVVLARAGTVAMAAGEQISLTLADGKGLSGISTTASAIASLIDNKLAVQAPDGQIILSAVAVNKLQAGVIKNSGSLQATSLSNQGGKIVLEADEIDLASTASIDVSGRTRGGTVLMGGDWQGSGNLRQATTVRMAAGATINANATDNGDGGKVVLWSNVSDANSTTTVAGSIYASAGPNGGNGGQIETSGHYLNVDGIAVSTVAPKGNMGEWLLDPANINITSILSEANFTNASGTFAPNSNSATSVISNVTLSNALNNTNVTITTVNNGTAGASTGNITISNAISWSSANTLTLVANDSISGTGNISMTGGGSVVFNTGNASADINNVSNSYSGLISGNGSVTKAGLGGFSVYNNNTYSGNTTVSGGVFLARGGSNSTATLDGNGNYTFASSAFGTGVVKVQDGATLKLYTNINMANYLELQGAGASGQSGALALMSGKVYGKTVLKASGTVIGDAGAGSGEGRIVGDILDDGLGLGLTINATTGYTSLYGTKSYSGTTLVKGTAVLASVDAATNATFNTTFNISSGGQLNLSGLNSMNAGVAITIAGDINGGGNMTLTNAGSANKPTVNLQGKFLLTGTTNLTNATLVLSNSSDYTIASNFTGSSGGNLNVAGTGNLTLTGNSTTFTSNLTINTGSNVTIGDGATSGIVNASIANNGTLNFNRTDAVTAPGVISGTGTLNKLGSNVLTLSGNNTLSGAINVNAGTLKSGFSAGTNTSGAFGKNATITLSDVAGVTLDVNGTTTYAGSLSGGANTSLNVGTSGTFGVGTNNSTSTFSGQIAGSGGINITGGNLSLAMPASAIIGAVFSGSGGLLQAGPGNVTFTGNSTGYTGNLTISSGSIVTMGDGTTNGILSAAKIFNNGTLNYNRSDNITVTSVISGNGALNQQGIGNLTLSGANTYTGNTTVAAGTLVAGISNSAATYNSTSGNYDFANGPFGTGVVKVLSGASLNVNTQNNYNTLEIAGSGVGGMGAIYSASTLSSVVYGNITLMQDNTALGSYTSTTAAGLYVYSNIASAAGTNYNLTANGSSFMGLRGNTSLGTITVKVPTLTLLAMSGNLTFANNFAVNTTSTLNLSTNVSVNGNVSGGGTVLSSGVDNVNGVYNITGTTCFTASTSSLTINSSTDTTLSSLITGAGNLTVLGTGNLTLTANSTGFTGKLNINTGSNVTIGDGANSGIVNGSIANNGTLNFNRTDNVTAPGAISGTGVLNKYGSNVLTLSGNSTFTGNITVGAGTLKAGFAGSSTFGAFGNKTNITLTDLSGVGLDISGFSTSIGSLTGGANNTLNLGTSTLTTGLNGLSTTYAGTVLGSGTLSKSGAGTFNLSGNSSTFTGGVVISAGNLVLTNTSVIGSGAQLINISGATGMLELQNVSSLNNTVCISVAGATLTVSSGNTTMVGDLTFGISGNISVGPNSSLTTTGNLNASSYAVSKYGLGTWIVAEPTVSTPTQSIALLNVNAGRMELNSTKWKLSGNTNTIAANATLSFGAFSNTSYALGGNSGGGNITNNGLLQIAPTSTSASVFYANVSGTGSVEYKGTGLTNVSKAQTYTGTTTIFPNASIWVDSSLPNLGNLSLAVINNGNLTITSGNSQNWVQSITGSGNVTFDAADAVGTVLAGTRPLGMKAASSYSGTTTLTNRVTLYLGGQSGYTSNASLGTGDIIFQGANSTLCITRTSDITLTNNMSGPGSIVLNSANVTTTLAGNVNIGGNISMNNSNTTLVIAPTGSLGSNGVYAGSISFNSSGITLEYASASDVCITGNLSGNITKLRKTTSNSNLTLTGNDNFNGGVWIEAGAVYALGTNTSSGKLGSGNISNNATLVFNHTDTGNLSLSNLAGNITGTGNVTFISVGNISIDKTINMSGTDSLIKAQSNANVTVNSSLTSSGSNGKIVLLAGAATAAGTATGGQIAINTSANLNLSSSGSVVMFQGDNSGNLTATLDARVVSTGANTTGVPRYKTYNASLGNVTSAVTGTRNYFYRVQPTATINGGTVNATKVYDGTTTANPIYTGGGSVTGVDGDTLTGCVTGASYNTSNANVINNTLVSNKSLTYNVTLASNNSAWVVTGYAGTVNPTSTVANITQAPLTIQANDAAAFVTLAASSGPFAGVSYSGFVHGENATTAGLTGTLNISRAAGNSAGTYALTPSGLSSSNYAITYRTGTYTIVPAQKLIIRVSNGTSVYGDANNFNVTSVSYLMPDNVTITDLTPSLTLSSGLYSVNDGVGGTASFKLGLNNATLSASNNAGVGLWSVAYNNLSTGGSNFNGVTVAGTQTITKRDLNITVAADNKVYDGNTTATFNLTTNRITGDALTLSTDALGVFSSKNAANGIGVTIGNVSISGADVGNYNLLNTTLSTMANITPKSLTLVGLAINNKVYDATTRAFVNSLGSLNGVVGFDDVQLNTSTMLSVFSDKNVANNKNVTVSGVLLDGLDANNYKVSNATTTANITPKALTVSGLSVAASKVYDGTNVAAPLGTANLQDAIAAGTGFSSDGKAYSGDGIGITGTPVGTYNSKDVATAANVSISGLSLTGAGSGNYVLTAPAPLAATITPAPLIIKANDDANFVTLAAASGPFAGVSYNGFVNNENATTAGLTGTLAIARSNNGSSAAGTYTLTPSGLSAGNYGISYQTGNYTIVPAQALLIRVSDSTSVYGSASSLSVSNVSYLMADNVTVANLTANLTLNNGLYTVSDGAGGSASFKIGLGNVTLSGSNNVPVGSWHPAYSDLNIVGNNFNTAVAVGTQTVTAKALTAATTALDKVYNGNASASVTLTSTDLIAGDNVSYAYTSAAFLNKNAGTNKTVTVANISLNGTDAGNYVIQNLVASTTANISQKALTVTGITAENKVYDGNTSAVVNVSAVNSTSLVTMGLVSGDNLTVAATGAFTNKNAGDGKTVNLTSTYAGADVGNYNITSQANATANITQRTLTITGITADNKVYNGSNVAAVNVSALNSTALVSMGMLANDTVTVSATGVFDNKNVGDNKTVTLNSSYSGADAGNYNITSQVNTTANITQRALTITGITADDMVYNGSNVSVVNMTGVNSTSLVGMGLVAGDNLTVAATGAFANKAVGTNKTVTLSSTYSGADVGNYNITSQASTSANITQRTLTITGITAADKVYDGSNTSVVNASGVNSTSLVGMGLVAGDSLTVAATGVFDTKNAGTNKTVTLNSTYSGADIGNYNIVSQANTTANITQKTLAITGITADSKVYDGNTTAVVNVSAVNSTSLVTMGMVSGDNLTVAATGTFADKNVGTNKTVNLTSSYSGADVGNYNITSQVNTRASIRPKALTITGITAANKVYDGDTTAVVNMSAVNNTSLVGMGLVAGDSLSVAATGAFADKNVGANKTVTLNSTYSGTDVGNYNITSQASTWADITASTSSQNTGTGSGTSTSTSTSTSKSASQSQPATVDSAALVKLIVPPVITVQPAPVTARVPLAMPSFNLPEATTTTAVVTDNAKAKETKADATDDSMSSQKALALVTQTRAPVIETSNTPTTTLALPATPTTLPTATAAATPSASVSPSVTAAPTNTPPTLVASVAAPTSEVKVAPSGSAPPANQVASAPRASGVLPVSVLGDSRMANVGLAFEEQPNDIRIQMTASPDVPKLAATGVRFAGNFKTFMVGNDRGEMVTYQGAMIGKRMVVVAETEASKNLARQDMQTVLAAAITTLGSSGSISLAQMEGVVLDLR